MGEKTYEATHDEICNSALEHYEALSKAGYGWLSTIPQAIEFYRKYYKQINNQKVREHIDSVLPDEKPRNKVLIIIQKCSCFDIDALVSEYTYYYDESAINEAKDKCRSLMKETDTISCDMYLADDEKISCT